MSPTLCSACQTINLYTLSAQPTKVWVEKHIIDRPPLNPILLRPRASLSPICSLCQILLTCIEEAECESKASVAFLSLVALPSGDYYEQFTDKRDESTLSLGILFKILALWMYRVGWEIRNAEARRKSGQPGLLKFNEITVQMAFEGAEEIRCDPHQSNISYRMDASKDLIAFVRRDAPKKLKDLVIGSPVRPVNSFTRKTWIEESLAPCLSSHRKCRQSLSGRSHDDTHQNATLPTRLIDVTGTSSDGTPFLSITRGKTGRYIALSYCWGEPIPGVPIVMLTSKTLESFQTRLPAALPKTIQDAIDVTRDLGYQYIWIDRFCIIQDDDDDWKREARSMCDVYECATLTIAAMASTGDQSGLYGDSIFQDVAVDCSAGEDHTGEIYIAPPYPRSLRMTAPLYGELEQCKWNTRGWVMQERLLSRRIVYFGQHQIFWECNEEDDSSTTTLPQKRRYNVAPPAWISYGTKALILDGLRQSRRAHFSSSNRTLGNVWGRIVQHYSNTKLTKQGDKLIAMEGIAQALRIRIPQSEYLYGHWEQLLLMDEGGLFWHTLVPSGRDDHSWNAWSGAPSWSWACYPGEIDWPCSADRLPKPGKPLIRAAKFMTRPASFRDGRDFTSEKILQVTGVIICARLESKLHPASSNTVRKARITLTGRLLHASTENTESITTDSPLFSGDVSLSIDQPCDRPPAQFWVLLFSEQQCAAQFYGGTTSYFTCNFLLLGEAETSIIGESLPVFHRLGTGSYVGKRREIRQLVGRRGYTDCYLI
ncbi:heterokaryon incompatibility protein-domain-containing protein [Nemania abortiva]|nr:heterokaryon incompatibility protein-domain-containing protein [Nemania abortiva]